MGLKVRALRGEREVAKSHVRADAVRSAAEHRDARRAALTYIPVGRRRTLLTGFAMRSDPKGFSGVS